MKYDWHDRFCYAALLVSSVMALVAMAGCGSAQMVTMKAEFALGSAVSLCYRTIDGVDELATDKIRVTLLNEGHDAAVQAYADYKPKIEKARAGCNAAADTYTSVEAIRKTAATANNWTQFNTWLPALLQAATSVAQVVTDIKGLVQ